MKHNYWYLPLVFIVLFAPGFLLAQIGGRHVYDFLNLNPSARIVSLGGVNVSTIDEDIHLAAQNPALVTDSMHKVAGISFVNYLADIGYGYAGYSQTFEGLGSFHTGIQYVSYGQLQGADEFGNITSEFSAGDLVWMVGYANDFRAFRYGANVKFIQSKLAPGFQSLGVALDLGAAYNSPGKLFSAGVTLRNIGVQLTTYSSGAPREPLPFEILVGISNKLRYMPLRFSVTITNLDVFDLVLEDPNAVPETDLSGNVIDDGNEFVDELFSHFVFSGEFLLGKAVRLRAGYNHLRRQELKLEERPGLTGFSLGAGIRVKRFSFDYGFASYGVNSIFQTHHFSLLYRLNRNE